MGCEAKRPPFSKDSNQFQISRFQFDGRSLAYEIQPDQNHGHAVALFHPALDAAQRAVFDFDAHAFAYRRGQADFQIRFKRPEDVTQLADEKFLVGHIEQVGQIITLQHQVTLFLRHLQKDIAREQRLVKHRSFAAIAVGRAVAGHLGRHVLPLAVLQQFLFAARTGMGDIPKDLVHAHQLVGALAGVKLRQWRNVPAWLSLFAFCRRTSALYEAGKRVMKKLGSILVVDDDEAIRQLFASCLRREGYEVEEAATGQQALHMAQKRQPDLVLLDVRLPDISGIEVCRQIKGDTTLKDVFVVLCSGEATSVEHKVDGLHTGADEYLTKPFGINELLARVQTLMRLRNTTAALRASEEHHRRLIDILPDAVCLIHPKGSLLAVNSQAVTMLGYANTEELLHKTIYELTPPEEHARIKADFVLALKAGIIRNAEYTMLKKNGDPFRVELSATVSLGIHVQSTGLLSVVRDVTERQRAQQALQASEERFRQLAQHIREVFWMSNVEKTEMIYVSPAYEEIWGQSCESLYAAPQNWSEAIHPDDRKRVQESIGKQADGEYDEIFRIIRPDGSIRWIQDRAFPIRDECRENLPRGRHRRRHHQTKAGVGCAGRKRGAQTGHHAGGAGRHHHH